MRLFQKKKMGENPPPSPNHKANNNDNNASASPSRFQMMQQQHIKHTTQASMTICSVATSTAGLHSSPSVRTQSTCDSSCFSSGGTSLIQYDSDDEGIGLTSSSSIEEYGSGGGGLRTLSAEELKKHEEGWKKTSRDGGSGGGHSRRERERLKLAFDNIRSERMGVDGGLRRGYEGGDGIVANDNGSGSGHCYARGSRHDSSFSSGLDGFQEWEKDLEGMDKDIMNNVRHGKVMSNEGGGFSKDIRTMDVTYKADSGGIRDEYREQARPDKKTNTAREVEESTKTPPPPNKVTAKPPREEKTNRKSVVVLGLGVVKDENNNNKESKTRTKDKRRHSSNTNNKDKKDKRDNEEAPSCVVSIPKSRASNIRRSQNAGGGTPSRAGRSHHTNGRHGSIGSGGGNKSRPSGGGPRMSRQAAKKRDESLHGNAYLVRQRVERMKNEELERQRLREAEVAAQHVIPENSTYVPDRAEAAARQSAEDEGKRSKSDDKKTKEQKEQKKQQRRSIQRAPPDLSIQESVDEADGMEIVHLTRPELRRSILEKNLELFDRSEC